MTKGRGQMDSYSAEVFAEARRQKIIDEAEHRRLLRSAAAADPEPVRTRSLGRPPAVRDRAPARARDRGVVTDPMDPTSRRLPGEGPLSLA